MRLILATLLLTLASPALAGDLIVFDDATRDIFVPAPGGAQEPGAQIVWNSLLTDAGGASLGDSAGQCVRIDAAGAFLCTTIFYLKDGVLVLTGRQEVEPKPSRWIISGGSGAFAGARGEASAIPVENRARFKYTVKFAD